MSVVSGKTRRALVGEVVASRTRVKRFETFTGVIDTYVCVSPEWSCDNRRKCDRQAIPSLSRERIELMYKLRLFLRRGRKKIFDIVAFNVHNFTLFLNEIKKLLIYKCISRKDQGLCISLVSYNISRKECYNVIINFMHMINLLNN